MSKDTHALLEMDSVSNDQDASGLDLADTAFNTSAT